MATLYFDAGSVGNSVRVDYQAGEGGVVAMLSITASTSDGENEIVLGAVALGEEELRALIYNLDQMMATFEIDYYYDEVDSDAYC